VSAHRYPPPVLAGDFARAGIGLVLCLGAVAVAGDNGFVAWLFGVCAVVFLLFGLRTALRAVTNFELTDTALTRSYAGGFWRTERAVAWQGLERFRLRFFPARRDRSKGWMELTLGDGAARVRLDSTLVGFDAIVRMAAGAASRRGVPLSESTLGNLAALGIVVDRVEGGYGAGQGTPAGPARH
jgi:hypothetical protein